MAGDKIDLYLPLLGGQSEITLRIPRAMDAQTFGFFLAWLGLLREAVVVDNEPGT